MPKGLGPAGRAVWKKRVAEFGHYTEAQLDLLRLLCIQYDRIAEARADIAKHGVVIEDARGSIKGNPAVRVEQAAAAQILKLSKVLGHLDPPAKEVPAPKILTRQRA